MTQLQIGELAKQKKEREKPRPQAAVSVADPEPEKGPTVEKVTQAPIITPVMAPQPVPQVVTPVVPQALPAMPPAGQPQAQQNIPPIHVHLNPGGNIQPPTAGRGRGGPMMRGRWRRPQGPPQPRGPPPGQAPPQYQTRLQCWGCGETGHMQRDCPINPWTGPQDPSAGYHHPGNGPVPPNNGPWMGLAMYWQ